MPASSRMHTTKNPPTPTQNILDEVRTSEPVQRRINQMS